MRRRMRIAWLGVAGLLAVASGCGRGADLVIATDWPRADCDRLGRESGHRIAWVRLSPGDDPTRRLDRLGPIDLILGGRVGGYRRLESAGRLGDWRVARR